MKKNKFLLFISIFLVAAIVTSGLIIFNYQADTTPSSSISFTVHTGSATYFIPLDATEEEIIEHALGDILEITAQDGQKDLGIINFWEEPITTLSVFLDVAVDDSRDLIIYSSLYGILDTFTVADSTGKIILTASPLSQDSPVRINNLDADTYRIEVRKHENANLRVVLRVFSELTTPEITLPELVAKQLVTVKNPYKVPLQVTLPSGTHTVPREATLPIPLAEGDNELEMHLADNGFVSPSITSAVFADTTPPEITITGTYIDEKTRRYLIDYTVSEPIKRLVINGKELPAINREPRGPGYRSCTFHIDNYPEYLVIEVTDLVGLTTKFSVKFADLDFVEEPAYP